MREAQRGEVSREEKVKKRKEKRGDMAIPEKDGIEYKKPLKPQREKKEKRKREHMVYTK